MLELSVGFATLGLRPRDHVELVVQLARGGISLARYPRDGHIAFDVPDETFEEENWSA